MQGYRRVWKGEWWEQHERVCIANTDPCIMCSERVLKTAMAAHLADCKELEITCQFGCKHTCKRKDMPAHKAECTLTRGPDSMVACKFVALGCPFESKRSALKDAEAHMKAAAENHLEMLSREVEAEEKGYLMEYVLLSEKTHSSEKLTTADGTEVWFAISTPENKDGYYSCYLHADKAKYLRCTAKVWVVQPKASKTLKLMKNRSFVSPKAEKNRGWGKWLKMEPGTLLKVEFSEIMATSHNPQPSVQRPADATAFLKSQLTAAAGHSPSAAREAAEATE
eukprot:g20587.t1